MTLRAYRLATAAAIGSTLALALSGPAAAAGTSITYFNGKASGSAINVGVSPSAVLNVNLSGVQQIVNTLPLGLGGTVNNVVGSTLANPTSDILVTVDHADAYGLSQAGKVLSEGNATSTPLIVNIASLQSELDLLNAALQNLPAGTVQALQSAIAPLLANDPTGQLANALNLVQSTLATPIADTLGNPSFHLTHSISANFGEDKVGDILTINKGGLLTPVDTFHLDPFEAKALPAGSSANNALTSLNIAPSLLGKLSIPSTNASLVNAVGTLQTTLQKIEDQLSSTASTVPIAGGTVVGLLGTVTSTTNNATHAIVQTASGPVDLSAIDQLVQQMANMRNAMASLNGLTMNDIISSGPATALGSINRQGDVVKADGFSQAVRIDAVKLNNPVLGGLLNNLFAKAQGVGTLNFIDQPLVSVQGIKASANVALDGVHTPTPGGSVAYTNAEGHLAEIDILGMKAIDTDTLLAPGTSCVIRIPGISTCNLAGLSLLNNLQTVTGPLGQVLPTILTVTLSRGAAVYPSTNSITNAAAKIVTLEAKVDLNLQVVHDLANTALGVVGSLSLPAQVTPGAAFNGTATLADAQFGVAAAEASLTRSVTCQVNCTNVRPPAVRPPSTGNDVLPLAILALALVGAGAGLSVRQARLARN